MAAVSATTFLGGVAGVGALRSLGGDKYKDSKKEDDDDGKKYWEEEDPKSKSFDKIIEFKKNELDKMFNFKKNKVDKLIKLKKDKLFFPLLPKLKLKDKVDKIKDAVKGGKDGKDKKDPVDIQINTAGAEEAAGGGGVSLTLSSGHISGTNIILVNGGQDTEGEEEVSRGQAVEDSGGLVLNIANSLRGGGLNNTAVIAAARGQEEAGGGSGVLELVEMRNEDLLPLVSAAEEVRGEKETFLQGSPLLKHRAGNQ